MADYDPEALGALCQKCPLKGHTVVPPEGGSTDLELLGETGIAIVGEAPGEQEEKQGRPFCGASGKELDHALRTAGIKRRDTLVSNTILCRPDGNKLDVLLQKISKQNKEAFQKAKDEEQPPPEPIPSPIDCCRPRLEAELLPYTRIITLGKVATRAVTKSDASIMAIRGGLMTIDAMGNRPKRLVMPTVHPAFVLRQMRWAHVFRNDITKAGRWFRGQAEWVPPEVVFHPDPQTLREFLAQDIIFVVDLETDGIESLTAKIRCVGVGTGEKVLVCGFLGKDGVTRFYEPEMEQEVKQVLFDFLTDPKKTKSGHNLGYYDRVVLEQQWGITIAPIVDTILLHRSAESELPHGLAYVASLYTEAPAWKTDRDGNKLSTGSETDAELHLYNALDVAINARVLPPLVDAVVLRNQVSVWQLDQKMQAVCCDMHTVGMYVDQAKRLEEEKKLLKRRHELLKEIRGRLSDIGTWDDKITKKAFNPGSVHQLRDILFERWKLTAPLDDKEALTLSGDPSTADVVLRSLLCDATVESKYRDIIKLVRYYRKVQKVLGTYVVKLRPSNIVIDEELGWDDDDDWIDKEMREKYGLKKQGIVDIRTGRMYPGYNAQVAVTGRLSSSKPFNAQNVPVALRAIICAAPGHVLVGADSKQLEVRVAAALWRIERYLQAFREGKDPHSMTAFMIFGEAFCKAAGVDPALFNLPGKLVGKAYDENGVFIGKGEVKELRSLSKNCHFASQYKAGVERVREMISATEVPAKDENGKARDDGTTDLPYALIPLKQVREMRENWLKGVPEYERGWTREIDEWKQQGFLCEPVTNRRRDFMDGESPQELVNFKVQSAAAGLMNIAMIRLHEQVPLNKWGPGTGIIGQVHDWIGIECPESEAPAVAKLLEECMTMTHPALPGVDFGADASIGHRWSEV